MSAMRSFDYDEAKRLYDDGMPLCDVAREFGVAPSTARLAVDPEYRERQTQKAKDWKKSRRGAELGTLRGFLRELDPTAVCDDADLVTAAAWLFGVDPLTISVKTGLRYGIVAEYERRMRANGIWVNDKLGVAVENYDDPTECAVEFWIHCLVARGDVVLVRGGADAS